MTNQIFYLLSPCPFCGGPPVLEMKSESNEEEPDDCSSHVWCHDCGCKGPEVNDYAGDPEDKIEIQIRAIRFWNNRGFSALPCYVKPMAIISFDDEGQEINLGREILNNPSAETRKRLSIKFGFEIKEIESYEKLMQVAKY